MTRLVLYNIEYLAGTTKSYWQYLNPYHLIRSRKDFESKITGFLKSLNPDLIALIESDNGSKRLNKDETRSIADFLGLNYIARAVKYSAKGAYRRLATLPYFKNQENALLSKHKLESIKYHFLKDGVKKVLIEAKIKNPREITIFIAHLALRKKTRVKQLKEIADLVNKVDTPVILAGDFNTFNIDELNILLDNTKLVDTYKVSDNKNTSPSWNPKYRLDNILTTPDIKVKDYKILDAHFSDHLPVMIDFELF